MPGRLLLATFFLLTAHAQNAAARAGESDPLLTIQGIWERSGYGDVLLIEKRRVTVFQYTRETCFQSEKLDHTAFRKLLTDIVIDDDSAAFTAIAPDVPAFRRYYARLDSLPSVCSEENRLRGFDAAAMFDHIWHTFNDYYAFFEERSVDWHAQYALLRSRLEDEMSGRALAELVQKLLAPIDDGHVVLESASTEFSPEKPRGATVALSDGYQSQSKFRRYREYASWAMGRFEQIVEGYLDGDSARRSGGTGGDLLAWGTIDSQVGYLRVNSMSAISTKGRASATDDAMAVRSIMDRVMTDLGDTVGMVVDVRFNGGGDDGVGLAIANRFTDTRRLAVSKAPRSYRGEGRRVEAHLVPEGETPYLKPVVLLAGPDSASATEVFIMAMRALPQVTQLGQATNGILSDELHKYLPKGWQFTLSNEVYYDHTGTNHEGTGITPHISTSVFNMEDIEAGRDSALETALAIVAAQVAKRDPRLPSGVP